MLSKRNIGIGVIIIGVLLIVTAFIIKGKVSDGRQDINSAQRSLDQGSRIFSSTPATKEIGKGITSGVQGKIDAGSAEANYYANLALWIQIGGAVFVVLGAGMVYVGQKKA